MGQQIKAHGIRVAVIQLYCLHVDVLYLLTFPTMVTESAETIASEKCPFQFKLKQFNPMAYNQRVLIPVFIGHAIVFGAPFRRVEFHAGCPSLLKLLIFIAKYIILINRRIPYTIKGRCSTNTDVEDLFSFSLRIIY